MRRRKYLFEGTERCLVTFMWVRSNSWATWIKLGRHHLGLWFQFLSSYFGLLNMGNNLVNSHLKAHLCLSNNPKKMCINWFVAIEYPEKKIIWASSRAFKNQFPMANCLFVVTENQICLFVFILFTTKAHLRLRKQPISCGLEQCCTGLMIHQLAHFVLLLLKTDPKSSNLL